MASPGPENGEIQNLTGEFPGVKPLLFHYIISEVSTAVKNIFHYDNKILSPFFIYNYHKIFSVKMDIYTKCLRTGRFCLTKFFYCDKIASLG